MCNSVSGVTVDKLVGGAAPEPQAFFADHPDRAALQAEAHARPPLPIVQAEAEVWHWVLTDWEAEDAWPTAFDLRERHQILDLPGGLLRLERHTEFVALTHVGERPPGPETANLLAACPGRLLTGARIFVRERSDAALEAALFGEARLFGGRLNGGKVEAVTDFQVGDNGLVSYVVTGAFAYPGSRGRTVKRLLELETYRMASLLALPAVRRSYGELEKLEAGAAAVTRQLSEQDEATLGDVVDHLARELSEIGKLKETLRYRIAASAAYHDIVQRRLDVLDEQPVGERQTLTGFIEHRLFPAINTVYAFDRRLDEVQRSVQSAMELARTRIDRHMEAQNQALLASMERRASQQVHLAQAVEGLSVAAITYYAVGLLSYLLKATPGLAAPVALSPTKLTALSVPVVAAIVWAMGRRARKQVDGLFEKG